VGTRDSGTEIMVYTRQLLLFWRKCKRLIEFLIFGAFDFIVLLSAPQTPWNNKRVAIVHLELLGDYFLWFPFGQQLATHLHSQGKEVIWVGNADWMSLAVQHFPRAKIVGVKGKQMSCNFRYRAGLLRQLRALRVGKVLHPSYPRDAIVEDAVVHALGAVTVGFDVGFIDRSHIDMSINNRLYTRLLPAMPNVHQSVRAAAFLHATGINETAEIPVLTTLDLIEELSGKRFFLLSPGGSRTFRQWPGIKVSQIARRALECTETDICVLTGTSAEFELCRGITKNLPEGRWLNLCGKTNLIEFVGLVAHSQWVLCNDSAAGHIAAIYGVPVIVVLGGGDFNRCYPYPENAPVKQLPVCVWQIMPCFCCGWLCRFKTPADKAYPCVENIDVEIVWKAVLKCIESMKSPEVPNQD